MARKNESPQKAAMREVMHICLKDNGIRIKNGTDVNAVMRGMMSVISSTRRTGTPARYIPIRASSTEDPLRR